MSAPQFVALDPARSVVVEACAGSGKTWMLVSRLLRLLLAGARPGDILAITFTRKAAREIEERLRQYLGVLATANDAEACAFLTERGLTAAEAAAALPRARALLELCLSADPAMTVTTFHGWFARMLAGSPLQAGVSGRALEENVAPLLDEAWAEFGKACGRQPQGEVAQALLALYERIGAFNTRQLLNRFIAARAEWQAWCDTQGGDDNGIDAACASFGVDGACVPEQSYFSAARRGDLAAFATQAAQNGAAGAKMAAGIVAALASGDNYADAFAELSAALLTAKGEPRKFALVATLKKRLSEQEQEALLRLHAELVSALQEAIELRVDVGNVLLNRHALIAGRALLKEFSRIKAAQRVLDFTDLECEVARLLGDESNAAYMQARLDARYKHILVDEFQDTNPLQWQILQAWLGAYGADVARPSVFIVGDPKQSIYRFRRAEPRLFAAAREFFIKHYDAVAISNDTTRRNAGAIVDAVNALFADQPLFAPFRPQATTRRDWPGRVEVLPLHGRDDKGISADASGMAVRDALTDPVVEAEDSRRAGEAAQLAAHLTGLLGKTAVRNERGEERPLRAGDVLILTRRRSVLGAIEDALGQADIPYLSPGRGGLLDTLEAQDFVALLSFLADPADDLSLAHVLRTPAFDVDDDVLQHLAVRQAARWWDALQDIAREDATLRGAVDMLSAWLHLAGHLPAHDLLDKVMHSADWLRRYRARVPADRWPAVHANLESLLELTLTVDAGRYPSLTRLIDELRRLSQAGDDESPDEGVIAQASGEGRVRIMTIHAAKGLEAPLVWLIDANPQPARPEGYRVLVEWAPGDASPRHFSILGRYRERGRARQAIFDAEQAAGARENLNLLYVAMTRAQQMFIASGIASLRGRTEGSYYELLAQAIAALGGEQAVGAIPTCVESMLTASDAGRDGDPPRHRLPVPKIGERQRADATSRGMSFGTALHAWLEAVTNGLPPPRIQAPWEDVVPRAATRILADPALKKYFDPASFRKACNETAFLMPDGTLGRIDRWVDTGEAIWILDYKSGAPADAPLDDYRLQLARYRSALRAIFPDRTVRSMLVFTDGEPIELD